MADETDDHLGIFGADGPDADAPAAGAVDVERLRALLARDASDNPDPQPPAAAGPRAPGPSGGGRRPRRLRKVASTLLAIVVMAGIVGGIVTGVTFWHRSTERPTDWAGQGSTVAVIRVQSGDGLADIAATLAQAGVVASAARFVTVAKADGTLATLQPGYYTVHLHSSAQTVVDELADPTNRVGHLRIVPGQTLADVTTVSPSGAKSVKPGIISAITDACVPTNGEKACFTAADLWHVEQTAGTSSLGVVAWATTAVDRAPDPRRRLEGVILPGDYDIAPGSTAQEALAAVVGGSAAEWNNTDIVTAAQQDHRTPYQLATIASLAQSEAAGSDMPKVARVIDNRLAAGMKLQFDSTVNYGLGRAQIATTAAERLDTANAYSTYAHAGLTPTPIGAVGPAALDAAEDPTPGTWLYFVAVDTAGHTCFSTTAEQHTACVAEARANGVFG